MEIETLDQRKLLSATAVASTTVMHPTIEVDKPLATSGPTGYSPSQLQTAYGFNSLSLNGTGQTIAIVDAYDDPTIQADLQAFDAAYRLAAPPSLTVMSQTGSTTNLPATDPAANRQNDWEVEESLDVEWAHALAPGAKIVLVEAMNDDFDNLVAATRTAASLPGVSVVSMSWGGDEFSSESSYDSAFTTPAGHLGVTFVSSTGDDGQPGGFPAYSPNVLAVGGTTLSLGTNGSYQSESGWSDSGGGISRYEAEPAYQRSTVTQTTSRRTTPDVSFDADPNTGVAVYDSFSNGTSRPWSEIGGTSLSAPSWGAVIALVDQARVQNGLTTLNGSTQTLPMLYQLHQTTPSAFHDISSGNNGFPAGTGYDLVTGLGSPVVNVLVPALSGSSTITSASRLVFQQSPTSGTAGQTLTAVKVAIENPSGQIVTTSNSTVTLSIASGPGAFTTGSISVSAVNGVATFSNLVLNTAGVYTLGSSGSGLTGATSQTLTINPGAAAKIAFQQLPTSATGGHALSPSVNVAIEDVFGNVATNNTSTVTVSVASGPGGFSTGSTTSMAAVNGVARFSNLILATAGTYTLTAKEGTLTSSPSSPFAVNTGLSAPQNVSAVALSSTSVQVTWSPVAGAQGYRVFQVNGTRLTLVAATTSQKTSATISGLLAGSVVAFKVEAYSGPTTADSQTVSVSLATKKLGVPALEVDVISLRSVELVWTPASGTQGYDVYWGIPVRQSSPLAPREVSRIAQPH